MRQFTHIPYIVIYFVFFSVYWACTEKDDILPQPEDEKEENVDEFSILTAENHPRLLMDSEDFTALQYKIAVNSDDNLTQLHNAIMSISRSVGLETEPLTFKLDASNIRLLHVSRNALARIFSCAYAYRLTGEEQFLIKAETDINAVCNFINWNAERHFLDAAEMAAAVAFGYDWLYNELKESTRSNAVEALRRFALQPALSGKWNQNFYESNNNWNQVCNGGLVTAALAIYESAPNEAKQIIEKAISSNAKAVEAMYSPHGNYSEGPSYWCYGTLFQVLMLSGLESTLGTDYGLSEISGFSKTGEYMLYTVGLNNRFFNYSDCSPSAVPALALWYFADKFNDPSLLFNEIELLTKGYYPKSEDMRLLPMLMAFANKLTLEELTPPSKKIWSGEGETPIAMVRTSWTSSDSDKYLGIKGGRASSSHGHMDAGSFVYDAYGVRWSMDIGPQGYTTIETPLSELGGSLWDMKQNSLRWDVFRLNNFSHSTITINDDKHLVDGVATIIETIETEDELGAILNLTETISNHVESAIRTIKIIGDIDLVVIDNIKAKINEEAKVRWAMVTPATPTVERDRIILTYGDKTMYLSASDLDVSYRTWSTNGPNSYDAPNPGIYIVGFEYTISANQSEVITTKLTPVN